MEHYVIIEKLKEAINGRKVLAAVFYTFNFDARFFENYLLTTFLPHVNFSDNEIQNTILWRKYINELPPVSVYCDFHTKKQDAPNLNYQVNTIDIPSVDGKKACFHPKVSFILLEDESLLVLTGSNNLTEGGWCTNREIIGIKELQNGKYFPYEQKHQLWNFLKTSNQLNGSEYSVAEKHIDSFFRKKLHSENADFNFYHSGKKSFIDYLKELLKNDDEEDFEYIEVISPYLTTGINLVNQLVEIVDNKNIYFNVPYKNGEETNITKDNYYNFQNAGVKWSRLLIKESNKGFRFNHSKIYRLKTSKNAYTIVGSVNFTDAAWRGRKQNGNFETAIVYIESLENWQPLLEPYHNNDIIFTKDQSDETHVDNRIDAPDFQFKLNWTEKTLEYNNLSSFNFTGQIKFNSKNIELKEGNQILNLNDTLIEELAQNPVVRVWQYHIRRELIYFPVQEGFESKPIPQKLRLKDGELIQLWENVSLKESNKSEIAGLIEKFIMSRMNVDGDLTKGVEKSKSTLNLMASHISALIRLEERVFTVPRLKGEYNKSKELIDYYLFVVNIDTLSGYINLLEEMYKEKEILPGVFWFLLNVLATDFYNEDKIKKHYKSIECSNTDLDSKIKKISQTVSDRMNLLKNELKGEGLDMKLLSWIKKEL